MSSHWHSIASAYLNNATPSPQTLRMRCFELLLPSIFTRHPKLVGITSVGRLEEHHTPSRLRLRRDIRSTFPAPPRTTVALPPSLVVEAALASKRSSRDGDWYLHPGRGYTSCAATKSRQNQEVAADPLLLSLRCSQGPTTLWRTDGSTLERRLSWPGSIARHPRSCRRCANAKNTAVDGLFCCTAQWFVDPEVGLDDEESEDRKAVILRRKAEQ
ncbi:hypothetical protein HMN09_01131400 [Mycena chlorophos]|uniref:Uncharacterized protein n=1 Tax=Mycena chlorophos TaxID=658473 RepID=A0A8H6VZD5_MYCCL|nr:hypothetical protein HMN09_01131400 [Mycena chlorophos]